MNKNYYEKIADLMLFAVNFKDGDKLTIQLNHDCREAAKVLTYKAYEKGAAFVYLRYIDDFINAAAISAGKKSVEYPDFVKDTLHETCQPGWKTISTLSFSDEGVYEGLEAEVSTAFFKQYQEIMAYRRSQTMSDAYPWSLTYIPTEETALKVFPDLKPADAVDACWKEVIKIMGLDEDAPVAFWKSRIEKAQTRTEYLMKLAPEYLEYKGPGTDFRVGLNTNALWIGGQKKSQTGELFTANLPTDEIFTSPDFRKAEGRVALTRPFVMHQTLGAIPEGAWFEFKDGKVIDYGAEKGKESLDALFARDERAKYLGEVALVDPHSPFAESGLTFYNGLYDENAACHLALGASYSGTLRVEGYYTPAQLLEMGMNQSAIHEDMMVGSTEVDVTAILPDNSRVDIIKGGKFLI